MAAARIDNKINVEDVSDLAPLVRTDGNEDNLSVASGKKGAKPELSHAMETHKQETDNKHNKNPAGYKGGGDEVALNTQFMGSQQEALV